MRQVFLVLVVSLLLGLAACGRKAVRIELVPVEERLVAQTLENDDADTAWHKTPNKIAIINLSGLLVSGQSKSLLSSGTNQVSDLRETLRAIAQDDSVKGVLLRINSPGGTVTASDMMYREIRAFKAKTQRPVVTCMMDVCASGGYYVSCASDYRIAYPTTITGSIGVIVQTINLSGTLDKLGISAKAITSGPNKDMGSPLRPMTKNDEVLIQQFVTEFYQGFLQIVRESPHHIKPENWAMVTDGRVVTGQEAAKLGLVDEVGDLDRAIKKVKELAHIEHARIISYTHLDEVKGSIYAGGNPASPVSQMNLINFNLDAADLLTADRPGYFYLWTAK